MALLPVPCPAPGCKHTAWVWIGNETSARFHEPKAVRCWWCRQPKKDPEKIVRPGPGRPRKYSA